MNIRVGMENGFEGHALAWMLDFPGCFVAAENDLAVCVKLEEAVRNYADWIARHETATWFDAHDIQINIEETWQCYTIDELFEPVPEGKEGYEVNAWFRHDWKPLTQQDIERGIKLLDWSRQDFLQVIGKLDSHALDYHPPGERWSIEGIIRHVGIAEWWYLDRFDRACPYETLPTEPMEIVYKSRQCLLALLPELENKSLVIGVVGEFWSPRKLLRRAVWHKRDHTQHIQKLLNQYRTHE